jgi:acetamidase/formamidase
MTSSRLNRYTLTGDPKTVHWGYYSSKISPVLRIDSGDTVTIVSPHGNPAVYEAAGIPPDEIPQMNREIFAQVTERGPGPHILVGPIYVEGAEPGDMLEVHIEDVSITAPFGYNSTIIGMGTLSEDYPFSSTRVLRMDLEKMTVEMLPGVIIPLNPFFGSMGVAPPDALGRVDSIFSGVHGGNLDNKELTSGTVLYLPVHVRGALFSVGDGHAVQGDGEVNVCALEAELAGTFQLFVHKNDRIFWPRGETRTHFITMGLNEDLDIAAKMAVREMIDYLHEKKGLAREEAYRLSSLAVDLHVTQVAGGVKGIHAMLPKAIFSKE